MNEGNLTKVTEAEAQAVEVLELCACHHETKDRAECLDRSVKAGKCRPLGGATIKGIGVGRFGDPPGDRIAIIVKTRAGETVCLSIDRADIYLLHRGA